MASLSLTLWGVLVFHGICLQGESVVPSGYLFVSFVSLIGHRLVRPNDTQDGGGSDHLRLVPAEGSCLVVPMKPEEGVHLCLLTNCSNGCRKLFHYL